MTLGLVQSVFALATILFAASFWLYFLYILSGPDARISFPRNLDQLQNVRRVFDEYATSNLSYTVVFFTSAYLYKQAFAIPGSVFMNLLSGALFGVFNGFILCCFLSAFGASSCFLLSKSFGKAILLKFAPNKIEYFRSTIEKKENGRDLFKYLLSLRIFPMTPNWLINMASPHVGVPLRSFFLSVLIGLAPYNFMCCNAGSALAEVKSLDDVISWKAALGLGLLAVGLINPLKLIQLYRNRVKL